MLTRTFPSHPTQLWSEIAQDVSADSTLTQLERQNEIIEAIRRIGQHERHGISINIRPHHPVVSLQADVECTVNKLFTGKAIAGRN